MGMRDCRQGLAALAVTIGVAAGPAQAVQITDAFLFGDSYTDTGASFPLTNGTTAGAYMASLFGIELVTSKEPNPGTRGVNFAESGARVAQGPNPPNTQPRSLTQQVAEFQAYVQRGAVSFDPASTLFFLSGGLNDHAAPRQPIADATFAQVATLYGLGARFFELALLPSLVPAFADSAANLNPLYRQLVPQLQALYPDATIRLSNWGTFYDNVLRDPAAFGITNARDQCFNLGTGRREPACTDPDQYFYYYVVHPSDRAHRIVGEQLYAEVLAVPEPETWALMAAGLAALGLTRRRCKA